jgi:ankyrin repeat protein
MGVMMIDGAEESNINELLHCAAAYCDRDTILQILQRGADIMAKDAKHCLPLEVAIINKNSELFFLMLNHFFTKHSTSIIFLGKSSAKLKPV